MPALAQSLRCARTVIGAVALAALCALAGCGSNHPPEAVAMPALHPKTQLATLAYGRSAPVIGGERLHAELLQRFYARHGFEPVWTTRQAQANALVDAVLRAGDQGLDPELFHATLLQHRAALPPIDRELLLSDAFLSYADALARGAVPVERRRDDETLAPEPINVAAVLDDAIDSRDPASVIEALAPTTPTYQALRQALQKYRPAALAGDKAAIDRVRMIEVNLERQRWLPRPLPPDRAWVNIADERLVLYRDDQPVFSSRVVVGQDSRHNQSPEFRATIDASFFNPPWVVPRDIVIAEILPKISSDPDYLTRNRMVMLASGEVEQLPSPEAGLGLVMFDMPNRFDVYLHDTPDRQIFNRDNRRISHGCIRVQNPLQFAALLLRQPIGSVNQGIAQGIAKASTTRHELPKPVPVFVVYQTAFADTDGTLQFRPDFYSRDAAIWQQLHKPGSEPVAPVTKHPVSLASASSGSAPSGSAPLGSVKPKSPAKKAGYVRRLTKS